MATLMTVQPPPPRDEGLPRPPRDDGLTPQILTGFSEEEEEDRRDKLIATSRTSLLP